MNASILIGLVLLPLLGGAIAAVAAGKPAAPPATAPADPAELGYRRLLALDDKVHEEIDQLIRENAAFKAKGAGIAEAALALKIEQRREPVRQAWETFLRLHPRHAKGLLAYGSFLNDLGEEPEAVKQWERAREIEPQNPAVWNNLANYHGHRGPIKKAFEYYAQAITLNPNEAIYHHNLGTTVFLYRKDAMEFYRSTEQQIFDRALAHYAEALRLDPDDFKIAADVAQTYYGIRPPRHDEAVAAWQRALKLAGDDTEREGVHLHLARVQINAARFAEARQHLALVQLASLLETKQRLTQLLEAREKQPSLPAKEK